jgi:uncharacterized protein
MRLRGAGCVITGASGGIGRAVAAALARRRARLVLVGRDEARLAAVAERTGGAAVPADLGRDEDVERVARESAALLGRTDVLVHAAGVGLAGPFERVGVRELEEIVAVDLLAPMRLTRLLLPGMLKRGHGAIVVVASIAGHVGVAGEAVYAGVKGGLIVFAESLRFEVAPRGVRVLVASPGIVDTPFFDRRGAPAGRRFPRPVASRRVAEAIARALERDRAEVFVPGWLAVAARLRGAWPAGYRVLAARAAGATRGSAGP